MYRRRLERWVKPGLLARKEERRQLEQRAKLLESEVIRLQGFVQKMREDHQHQTDDTQRRLINYEKDRIRLVDQYEKRTQQLQVELQRTEGDLIASQQRAKSLDRATEDAARMANEKIFFERRAQELESRLLAETERLRSALDEVSQEAATLRVAAETARRDRETIDKARVQADQRAIRLETQIAALRQTWGEMNSRLERAEAERAALEKLNQELAMALKAERSRSQVRLTDQGLDRLGFKESTPAAHRELSELERKGFGL
jgi:chromosome segregation ATPase